MAICLTSYRIIINKDRIKRKTIIRKTEESGTGFVDVLLKFQALKAVWIPRFSRNKDRSILGNHLGHLLIEVLIGVGVICEIYIADSGGTFSYYDYSLSK